MIRHVVFGPTARGELDEAVAWHERKQPGTGAQLDAEVNSLLEQIQQRPERFRKVSPTVRMARLKKFWRYSIYFTVTAQSIGAVAVFHAKRDPQILAQRLA